MEDLTKVIVFQLNNQPYGISVEQVMSIEKLQDITVIPNTSKFIEGVINLRGEIIPLINLREKLNLDKVNHTEQTRVLIVQLHDLQVGLIVDSATDVIDIDSTVIESAPEIIHGVDQFYLLGVVKLENSLLLLLDVENILKAEEIHEVKEVGKE